MNDFNGHGEVATILGTHYICSAKNAQSLINGFKDRFGVDISDFLKDISRNKPIYCDIVLRGVSIVDIIFYNKEQRELAIYKHIRRWKENAIIK